MLLNILIWASYIGLFVWLAKKGKGHDVLSPGPLGFGVQAFAYVATYISAVALVGFGGLAYMYGLQMLLVAAGNVWLGAWMVYRFISWPTKLCQASLEARTPAQLLAKGHKSPLLGKVLALIFSVFLGVYASAVIKGAALLLAQIVPLPVWALIWSVGCLVGFAVFVGGLRGVLYTEAMQGVVMLFGICMLIGAVFIEVGGPIEGFFKLSMLPPTKEANMGFISLSSGEQGWFIISLVVVTSVAIWAQPQMIQRQFALSSKRQLSRICPLAMLVLTVLVGGAYYIAALSRLFLPPIASPDEVMPVLVKMLLPNAGLQFFVLAIVSASISTATAIFHIAVSAVAEDLPGRKTGRIAWFSGIIFFVILACTCAQIKGQLIALLCTTSWSIVGSTVLVPYLALVVFGKRSRSAAWFSCSAGFLSCLFWYLMTDRTFAVMPVLWAKATLFPPFFVGFMFSLAAWFFAWFMDTEARKAPEFALKTDS